MSSKVCVGKYLSDTFSVNGKQGDALPPLFLFFSFAPEYAGDINVDAINFYDRWSCRLCTS